MSGSVCVKGEEGNSNMDFHVCKTIYPLGRSFPAVILARK
ncbi:hypothetical protein NRI_0300 [Neorickettsia risticii str. Illinois]|uniref:Uncharacterized protein n=1 Tax=Neorickettsia risticii (strain Illinois) TaxID=434131 RepID=C6V4H1_NEORI|nr:hypothetical protein NRI_0300 [Neorickettsia risticii str. Illinois]